MKYDWSIYLYLYFRESAYLPSFYDLTMIDLDAFSICVLAGNIYYLYKGIDTRSFFGPQSGHGNPE
jgi:hypothetical protein